MKKLFRKMVKFSMTTAIAGTLAVIGAGFIGTPAGMFADTFIPSTVSAMTQDENGVYLISTPDDLIEFLYKVDGVKNGKFTQDIVFPDGYTHSEIDELHCTQHSMTLNGQKHKLVNYNINSDNDTMRCFGEIYDSIIKNLIIDVGTLQLEKNQEQWGAFAEYTQDSGFVNCTAMGDVYFNGENMGIAGMVGRTELTKFISCTNYINFHCIHKFENGFDTLVSSGEYVAGIAAEVQNSADASPAKLSSFYDCKNYGIIEGTRNLGGIASIVFAGNAKIDFDNCENNGEIKGYIQYIGGIIGQAFDVNINNCINNATVSKTGIDLLWRNFSLIGGIVGSVFNTPTEVAERTISGCVNYGTINGGEGALTGGIAGEVNVGGGIEMSITDCINYGNVMSEMTEVGGIIGILNFWELVNYEPGKVKFTGNINNGDVKALNKAGGMIGRYKGKNDQLEAEQCYNSGKIDATAEDALVGGLVGNVQYEIDISEWFSDSSGEHKHDYELESKVDATTEKEGSEIYVCWCGSEETRVLPKLENPANETDTNKPTNDANGNNPSANNPEDGTNSSNPSVNNNENGDVAIEGKTPARGAISSVKNSKKKTAVVTIKVTKNAAKYEIQIASKKNFAKAKKQVAKNKKLEKAGKKTKYAFYKTKTVTVKNATKKTIKTSFKKLKKGQNYYVRVRGVNGDKTGKWSKVKKVTIRK